MRKTYHIMKRGTGLAIILKKALKIQIYCENIQKQKINQLYKKIRDNIQYIVSQDQLHINHLIKLLKRGDPDISQDQINKYIKRYNEDYEYNIKKLDNLESK